MKAEVEEFQKRNQEDLAKPQIKAWNFAPNPTEGEAAPVEAKAEEAKTEQTPAEKL
jgi:hypothetical protein